jgi:hypothetical protein
VHQVASESSSTKSMLPDLRFLRSVRRIGARDGRITSGTMSPKDISPRQRLSADRWARQASRAAVIGQSCRACHTDRGDPEAIPRESAYGITDPRRGQPTRRLFDLNPHRPMTTDAVTGATSYTGRFIAERLLSEGRTVIDLTRSPHAPHPLGEATSTAALDFDDPDRLRRALADWLAGKADHGRPSMGLRARPPLPKD